MYLRGIIFQAIFHVTDEEMAAYAASQGSIPAASQCIHLLGIRE